MGIILKNPIDGQVLSSTATYCYLYEPTLLNIEVDDELTTKLYIDVEELDLIDNSVVNVYSEIGNYDLAFGSEDIELNLMDIVSTIHDSNVYRIGNLNEDGFENVASIAVLTKYKYKFKFYTDVSALSTDYVKIPIIGERGYQGYVPNVISSQSLTEADLLGIDLSGRWEKFPNVSNALSSTPELDASLVSTWSIEENGKEPLGGMLFWKSRYGGWMYWGFDLKEEKKSLSYNGSLKSSMFEVNSNGIHIPSDYTSINSSYSITLKSLDLTSDELMAVSGINNSPAIYYMKSNNFKVELMRLGDASVPLSNLADGGDFSVTLNSISTSSQKAR